MATSCLLRRAVKPLRFVAQKYATIRNFSFTFAGPRNLDEIIKKDLVEDKTGAEVADVWYSYHESKDNMLGLVLKGKEGEVVLTRAATFPFFVQPVFRDDGFFMLISQFLSPSHFLLGMLEDYKMDPNAATPLLTFSVFNDYADSKDISLVRCDILNRGIQDDEGRKVVQSVSRIVASVL
jgi:hypothetical protein